MPQMTLADLWAELKQLRDTFQSTPRLHRKDVCRLLGISVRTLSRRMTRPDFPAPIYDAGRPKWRAADFAARSRDN